MRKIYYLVALFITFNTWGQQSKIDSLISIINESKIDTIKSVAISNLMVQYYYIDIKKSKFYCDSLKRFSKRINDDLRLALAYRMSGTLNLLIGGYAESENDYNASLYLAKKIKNRKLEAYLYSNIATLKGRLDLDKEAINYYHKSIIVFKELNKDENNLNSYLNLGISYNKLRNINESIKYNIKALEIAERIKDEISLSYIYITIGDLYVVQKAFGKAIESYQTSEKYALSLNNNEALMKIYNSLGYLYETNYSNYKKAFDYYLLSNKYAIKHNDVNHIITSSYNVGLQYIRFKNFNKADEFTNVGLRLSDSLSNINQKIYGLIQTSQIKIENGELKEARELLKKSEIISNGLSKVLFREQYFRLSESFNDKKLYKDAYYYLKKYSELNDSILVKDNIVKVFEVEEKYETAKKENENLQLKQENSRKDIDIYEKTRKNWFFGLGLLFSFFGIIIYSYFYRKTKRQKEMIENLQVELHHTVKNNLSFISTFIDLTIDDVEEEKIQNKLIELKQRIESINEVHKELYEKKGETQVKMKKYIQRISSLVNESYSDKKVEISENIDESITLSPNNSFPIGLIINEFLTNSYKYAFRNIINPTINIDFSRQVNQYVLELSDNGIGIQNSDLENESFGLNLMQNLSKQLGGSYNFDGQNGVKILIQFPIKK